MGGGEGEEGGTRGGGSVFFDLGGVFPCRALWALCRSKMGGNHVYTHVHLLCSVGETCFLMMKG